MFSLLHILKCFLRYTGITNEDVIAISEQCPQLKQLDLLGSTLINEDSIESVLKRCLRLEFLDLSFCDKINNKTIEIWIKQGYKNCFKRSYQPDSYDIYTEFA